MKMLQVLALAAGLTVAAAGCPKEPEKGPGKAAPKEPTQAEPAPQGPGALPADDSYKEGSTQAAVMQMETRLEVEGLVPDEEVTEEVKRARDASVTTQTWMITDERGKLVFETSDFYVPKGTEVRFHPEEEKYLLYLPADKTYWSMTGSEIGNLLEGGPVMDRTGYTLSIKDTDDKETIAGVEAVRTDAELGFSWKVKTKSGSREGEIAVGLQIWHTDDPKLQPAWSAMMVDFLTMPFKDKEGEKVVKQLKDKIKFPVKWTMEVRRTEQGDQAEKRPSVPRLITVAKALEVKEVQKPALAAPPAAASAAKAPFQFGEGGQTIKEELLGMIPPLKREPPKVPEPADKE